MTPAQVAAILGVHVNAVRAWLAAGDMPGIKLPNGRDWRVRRSDLDALLKGNPTW